MCKAFLDQRGLLLLCQPSSNIVTFTAEMLEPEAGLLVRFLRLTVMRDFKLPSLGVESVALGVYGHNEPNPIHWGPNTQSRSLQACHYLQDVTNLVSSLGIT